MARRMVFKISPEDNTVSGLEYKNGISLVALAKKNGYEVDSKRVSEILFDKERRMYYVIFRYPDGNIHNPQEHKVVDEYFESYEDAVQYEIEHFHRLDLTV